MSLAKLLRTMQVAAAGREDLRFALHARVLAITRRAWRADAEGLRAFPRPDPFILDVGAHRGLSLGAFRMMRPGADVRAFEPNPRLAATLAARWAGTPGVEVRAYGLGAEPLHRVLHVPHYRGYAFDGLASFDREAAAGWLGEGRVYRYDPARLRVDGYAVEVRRLDDEALPRPPDLLKLYVQGHEAAVLAGASRLLAEHRPAILAPARSPALDALLAPLGYARHAWSHGRFRPGGEGSYFSWHLTADHLAALGSAVDG